MACSTSLLLSMGATSNLAEYALKSRLACFKSRFSSSRKPGRLVSPATR